MVGRKQAPSNAGNAPFRHRFFFFFSSFFFLFFFLSLFFLFSIIQANDQKFVIYPELKPIVTADDLIVIPDDVQEIPDEELSYIEVQNGGTSHFPFVVEDDNIDAADPGWWETSQRPANFNQALSAIQPIITGSYGLRKRKRVDDVD